MIILWWLKPISFLSLAFKSTVQMTVYSISSNNFCRPIRCQVSEPYCWRCKTFSKRLEFDFFFKWQNYLYRISKTPINKRRLISLIDSDIHKRLPIFRQLRQKLIALRVVPIYLRFWHGANPLNSPHIRKIIVLGVPEVSVQDIASVDVRQF